MAADGSIAEAAEIRVHADGNDRAKEPAAAILIAVCWLFLNGQPAYPTTAQLRRSVFFKKYGTKEFVVEQGSSWMGELVRK